MYELQRERLVSQSRLRWIISVFHCCAASFYPASEHSLRAMNRLQTVLGASHYEGHLYCLNWKGPPTCFGFATSRLCRLLCAPINSPSGCGVAAAVSAFLVTNCCEACQGVVRLAGGGQEQSRSTRLPRSAEIWLSTFPPSGRKRSCTRCIRNSR